PSVCVSTTSRTATKASELASCDVSTVTATSFIEPAAATAASSIAVPPAACTVAISTPRSAAARTAPATVFGMSCHLRSRKTGCPACTRLRTNDAPLAVNSTEPTFTAQPSGSVSSNSTAAGASGRSSATIRSAIDSLQVGDHPLGQPRIGQRRSSNRDKVGSCPEILAHVSCAPDATDPDDRNVGQPRANPPDRQHAGGEQRRTTNTPETVAESGFGVVK